MKVSKLYTGILLASTLIVTGCGSDDSDSTIITDSNTGPIVNNELNYTAFDSFTDISNGLYKKGWGKITFKINNNGLTRTTSTVVGSSDNAYQISIGDEENQEGLENQRDSNQHNMQRISDNHVALESEQQHQGDDQANGCDGCQAFHKNVAEPFDTASLDNRLTSQIAGAQRNDNIQHH